jgi:hypothetical protein
LGAKRNLAPFGLASENQFVGLAARATIRGLGLGFGSADLKIFEQKTKTKTRLNR